MQDCGRIESRRIRRRIGQSLPAHYARDTRVFGRRDRMREDPRLLPHRVRVRGRKTRRNGVCRDVPALKVLFRRGFRFRGSQGFDEGVSQRGAGIEKRSGLPRGFSRYALRGVKGGHHLRLPAYLRRRRESFLNGKGIYQAIDEINSSGRKANGADHFCSVYALKIFEKPSLQERTIHKRFPYFFT